ncbi:MAG: ADP-heptose--LPS heptosyltransferase 2 [Syntrophaceae bacterium PtaU1.Bin231]|nr:MAG: ADP-heptose--LPS heptosyltransferase 2 [Syntrophaceae bacterium PtaU1.Bin231]HOG17123.1 glycosyltransferase family 9 protein [Syntrophales bacterium]
MIDCSALIHLQTKAACALGRILCPRAAASLTPERKGGATRILVVKADEIGDFVLATVFLRELRLLHPRAEIALVVNPATYNLAELCPYVDEVLVYRQGVRRLLRPFLLPWRAFRMGHALLRQRDFDLAVMPRWDMDGYYASYIALFSRAKRRIGYSEQANERKKMVNRGFDRLLTEAIFHEAPKHEVERHLDLIRHLGGRPSSQVLELWLDAADEKYAREALAGQPGTMPIALCPGAGTPWRRWPIERFIELAKRLKRSYGASFVIVGGREDASLGRAIGEALGGEVLDVTGRTTLRQTAAILKRCRLYVGNDTGSMHLAAASGVPVVELSCFPAGGPDWHWNSPLRFGPWGVAHRILQPDGRSAAEGFAPAIEEITVDRAACAVDDLFRRVDAAAASAPVREFVRPPSGLSLSRPAGVGGLSGRGI